MSEQKRELIETIVGRATSDGDGVKLTRIFGGQGAERFDPFLMLDEFGSDEASEYIGGFPSHPHRGFETVTYMLEGRMLHQDHLGNQGLLEPGGVQWMTAGRGIIHSEMPQQSSGLMRGFQLWVNLPAEHKLQPASYRDMPAEAFPFHDVSGGQLKVIAGSLEVAGQTLAGPVQNKPTEPLYVDVHLKPNQAFSTAIADHLNVLLYVYEGDVRVGEAPLRAGQLGRLSKSGQLSVESGAAGARLLILAGKPLGEPIVQYGPFVMNSREEIEQALRDYRDGRLAG
ncbi:pirin family protein [Pseudomonas profundi]|uniref:pirin family protein n=1 Tax=Pseudomonas profundi TaxID=1981513 RepID=UPI00123B4222|nr:pirin family protein [Pseudomonas profundi]